MKWRTGRKSENIEDRRSSGISGKAAGGIGGLGILLLLLISMFLGVDPGQVIQGIDSTGASSQGSQMSTEEQNESAEFVSLVLGDTEATWSDIFAEDLGRTYIEPKLVLFSGGVQSACGQASSQVGPFYCPSDQKVYLDLEFLKELQDRLGATGDFAQAYVISHEVGHHVQTLTGTLQYVDTMNKRVSQKEANELSVALELQADCYAGVWANRASQQDLILEPGDIEEGLNAASAVGDDRLQKQSQGYVVPDSFTHGTSAQRVASFRKGLESGDIFACDSSLLPPAN
ncbi:KPN_02809 family neutral zinc metallopeptidase [Methanothrix soehngenii]|jgi:predicted metalloprotease|uniref:KPN_02809 family neutral zinc metallopeptidase n=2 Tax=Methanothrix soehngenii TaxID=2223 RepID=UPI0023F4F016|nr:neutral zinc metallopeptidase [Methanothrix soehngenii]MDD5256412.1 zinc metallopeptidase [Methanothrix soehngenii]